MRIFSGRRFIPVYVLKLLCSCLLFAGVLSARPTECRASRDDMNRIVQERNRVESNLKGLKKQLEEYQLKLNKSKKDEVLSMDALKNIRKQILVFERLITENQTYLGSLDREIAYLQNQLEENRNNYHRVSSDFQRVAVAAYKHGGTRDAEMVFASSSVNDAMIRTRYMGLLSQSVRSKVTDLQTSAEQMETAREQLQQTYRQKQEAMKAQQVQLQTYSSKKKEKEAVLNDIKKDRGEYLARITEVRKKQREMQSKIESLIMAQQQLIQKEQEKARADELKRQKLRQARQARLAETRRLEAERHRREAAASAEAARLQRQARTRPQPQVQPQPQPQPSVQVQAPTRQQQQPQPQPSQPQPVVVTKQPPVAPPQVAVRQEPPRPVQVAEAPQEPEPPVDPTESEIDRVSADFDAAGSSLPWPVKNGVIVRKFGSSLDKELNLVTTSNGIDISVPVNTSVKAVSGGKVAQIAFLPTFGNVVIIRHQKSYLTVYANLARVSVTKGEVIRSQQLLGSSGPMPEGGSIVHFEVWKGKVKQNPQKWLR
ncbi:MAG: peptidoglycan DD-metalloendopeptidase family protein [Chlorobiaceae bacterium]|nr:peptidoglycan DD-metalloendopeptidase family protein [Chlorobiaceae bacterium]